MTRSTNKVSQEQPFDVAGIRRAEVRCERDKSSLRERQKFAARDKSSLHERQKFAVGDTIFGSENSQ